MIDMPLLRQAKNIVHLQQIVSSSADTEQSTDSNTWKMLHTNVFSLQLCISVNIWSSTVDADFYRCVEHVRCCKYRFHRICYCLNV